MGNVIFNPRVPQRRLPQRRSNVQDIAFIERMTAGKATTISQATGENPMTMNAGDPIFGGKFVFYNPSQGIRVRFDNGKEITIPNNLDERVYKHIQPDGSIDMAGAIADGLRWSNDLRRMGVSGSQWQQAENAAKGIVEERTATAKATGERLAPYIKDGSLDIIAAYNAGLTNLSDYAGWNVTEKDLEAVRDDKRIQETLDKYKLESGSFDVVEAYRGGMSKEDLKKAFGLSDSALRDVELYAEYVIKGDKPTTTKTETEDGETVEIHVTGRGDTLDIDRILKDVNALDGKEAQKFAEEINEALGLELENIGGRYEIPDKTPKKGLPEGVTPEMQTDLHNQLQDVQARIKEEEAKLLQEEKEGYHGRYSNADELLLLHQQEQALSSMLGYIDAYATAPEGAEFEFNPTAEDIEKLLKANHPDILKELTPHMRDGHFDVLSAVYGGVSDDTIRGLGYTAETLEKAHEQAEIIGKYGGIDDFDVLKAIRGGETDEALINIGYSEDNLKDIREYVNSVDQLVHHGYYDEEKGTLDWGRIVDILDDPTQGEGIKNIVSDGLKAFGIDEEQLQSVREAVHWVNDDIKANHPELYQEYLKYGLTSEFYEKADEYNAKKQAEYDEHMKELESYFKSDPKLEKIYNEQGAEAAYQASQMQNERYQANIDWLRKNGAVDENGNVSILTAFEQMDKRGDPKDADINKQLYADLEEMFGADNIDKYYRYWRTVNPQVVIIGVNSTYKPPKMSDAEYADWIRPEGIPDNIWAVMKPHIKVNSSFDDLIAMKLDLSKAGSYYFDADRMMLNYTRELTGKVPLSANAGYIDIFTKMGFDDKTIDYLLLYDKRKPNVAAEIEIALREDWKGFLENMFVASIPFVGTAVTWKDDNWLMRVVGISTDIAFIYAPLKAAGAAARAGKTSSAIAKAALTTLLKQEIIGPLKAIKSPVAAMKYLLNPIQILVNPKVLPLESVVAGKTIKGKNVSAVLKGKTSAEAVATLHALGKVEQRAIKGGKNIVEPVIVNGKTIAEIKYVGSGNVVIKDFAFHSTPSSHVFKGEKGVTVKLGSEGGLYAAPEVLPKYAFSNSKGQGVLYAKNAKGEIIGIVGADYKVLDFSGNPVEIGKIAPGTDIINYKGKKVGKLEADGKIIDSKGNVIGHVEDGRIVVKDKLNYPEGLYLAEDAKIISTADNKTVIAKTTTNPTFVAIGVDDIRLLPDYLASAKTDAQVKKRMMAAIQKGELANQPTVGFKPYKNVDELEIVLPGGKKAQGSTNLVPIVDKNGKQITKIVHDDYGRPIEMVFMQVVDPEWFAKSLNWTKAMQGRFGELKAMPPKKLFKRVFGNEKAATEVLAWMKKEDGVMLGSGVEELFTHSSKKKIKANDLDIAVKDPTKKAPELYEIVKRNMPGKEVRLVENKKIQVLEGGIWKNLIDVDDIEWVKKPLDYGLDGFEVVKVDGIGTLTLRAQFNRVFANRMMKDFGKKGFDRLNRLGRVVGEDLTKVIGIGAKPPSLKDVLLLKKRGVERFFIDIFNPTKLSKTPVDEIASTSKASKLKAGSINPASMTNNALTATPSAKALTPARAKNALKPTVATGTPRGKGNLLGQPSATKIPKGAGNLLDTPSIKSPLTKNQTTKTLDSLPSTKASKADKARRIDAIKKIDPGMEPQIKRLMALEDDIIDARQAYLAIEKSMTPRGSAINTKAAMTAKARLDNSRDKLRAMEFQYRKLFEDTYEQVRKKAVALDRIVQNTPARLDNKTRLELERQLVNIYTPTARNDIARSNTPVATDILRATVTAAEPSRADVTPIRMDTFTTADTPRANPQSAPDRANPARGNEERYNAQLQVMDIPQIRRELRRNPEETTRLRPRFPLPDDEDGKADIGVDKIGSVSWKQGLFWLTKIYEQGKWKTYYSRYAPSDAQILKGTPKETFYARGKPPAELRHEMGIVNVNIYSKKGNPLHYSPSIKSSTKMPKHVRRAIGGR